MTCMLIRKEVEAAEVDQVEVDQAAADLVVFGLGQKINSKLQLIIKNLLDNCIYIYKQV